MRLCADVSICQVLYLWLYNHLKTNYLTIKLAHQQISTLNIGTKAFFLVFSETWISKPSKH